AIMREKAMRLVRLTRRPRGAASERRRHRLRQTWLRPATRLLLVPLVAGLIAVSGAFTGVAHADTVPVSSNELRYQLFVGNERITAQGNMFWVRGMEQAWLLDYRAQHPDATQEQMVTQLAWFNQKLHEKGLYDDLERPIYQVITAALQA